MRAGIEKISHFSNGNEANWSKTNLSAYLFFCKSPKGVTMIGNNNFYKTIWENGNKEYNEKYICCFIAIWNLISAITYKCGRVVLLLISVYFTISKLILLFSYSFHATCIMFSNIYFYIARSIFPFLFNWSQSKVNTVNQMRAFFFLRLKNIYFLFSTFWKWSYSRFFDIDQCYETRRWK